MAQDFPPIDISPHWVTVHEHLLHIVDLIPDDKLDWTPKPELWNSRGILIHISDARDRWLADRVRDGDPYPNIWTTARTRDDLSRELIRTFSRLQRFLSNATQLDASYTEEADGRTYAYDGQYVAFHLLEHDIHHRAELLQRLALMGVAHDIDI